jgi:hypothetical protein
LAFGNIGDVHEPQNLQCPVEVKVDPPHGTLNWNSLCQNYSRRDATSGSLCEIAGCLCASVDLSDGEKKVNVSDLALRGRGIDFRVERSYRSFPYRRNIGIRDFAESWTLSYVDEYLLKDGSGADLEANYFNLRDGFSGGAYVNLGSGVWGPPLGQFTQLRNNPHTGEFEIREDSGALRVYHGFSGAGVPQGRLKRIEDRGQELEPH